MKLELDIREEHLETFRKVARYLLAHTYIVEEKEKGLFAFVENSSNLSNLSDYFGFMGFDVYVDKDQGVAMIKPSAEEVSSQDSMLVRFKKCEVKLLLVLWQFYREKIKYGHEPIVTMAELTDRIAAYGLEVSSDKRKLKSALGLFRRYNLIYYNQNEKGEESEIALYPSIMFGMNIGEFEKIYDEYSSTLELSKEPEESVESEEEDI